MSWLKSVGSDYLVPGLLSVAAGAAYVCGAPIAAGTVATILTGCSIKAVACKILEDKAPGVIDKTTAQIGNTVRQISTNYILGGIAYICIDSAAAINKMSLNGCKNSYESALCVTADVGSSLCIVGALGMLWESVKFGRRLAKETLEEKDGYTIMEIPNKYAKSLSLQLNNLENPKKVAKSEVKSEEKKA